MRTRRHYSDAHHGFRWVLNSSGFNISSASYSSSRETSMSSMSSITLCSKLKMKDVKYQYMKNRYGQRAKIWNNTNLLQSLLYLRLWSLPYNGQHMATAATHWSSGFNLHSTNLFLHDRHFFSQNIICCISSWDEYRHCLSDSSLSNYVMSTFWFLYLGKRQFYSSESLILHSTISKDINQEWTAAS